MPILSSEPAKYPAGLFDDGLSELDARRWSVLHTKSRQEKSLARQLNEHKIPFYLPLVGKRLLVRGKALRSFLPLFGGYVFLLADRDEQLVALGTRRVVRAIDVIDQQRLWSDLRQVHQLLASGVPVSAEDRLGPGSPVEIQSGPLMGLRGVIVKSASGNRFIVKVDFIERGASVLLSDAILAPAEAIA